MSSIDEINFKFKDLFTTIGWYERCCIDSSMCVDNSKENAKKFGNEEEICHYRILSNKGYATSDAVRVNADGTPFLITNKEGKQSEVYMHLETFKLVAKTEDFIFLKYNVKTQEIWITFRSRMQDDIPSMYGLLMLDDCVVNVNTLNIGNAFTKETDKCLKIGDKFDEFKFYNDGQRDPRQPSIAVVSCTVLCATTKIEFEETDYAKGTQSFSEKELKTLKDDELKNRFHRFAFDHIDLALKAIEEFKLRLKARKYEEIEAKLSACIAELKQLTELNL